MLRLRIKFVFHFKSSDYAFMFKVHFLDVPHIQFFSIGVEIAGQVHMFVTLKAKA